MAKFRVEFQNISRGVRTQHGTDNGAAAIGKPGENGYQPAIDPKPIMRGNPRGVTIHNVAPDAIGTAEMSADGVAHFEKIGWIKVISKEPVADPPGFLDMQTLLAENAALKARLAERDAFTAKRDEENRKPAKA